MSCGKPHETPCAEVLDHLYEYIDAELASSDIASVRQHLDECGPCLREYGIEETVRLLVKRSCCESAPEQLRTKVLLTLVQVRTTVGDGR